MILIVDVTIMTKGKSGSHYYATLRKEWKTTLTPFVGLKMNDGAWKGEKEIAGVVFIPDEDTCVVQIGNEIQSDDDACERTIQAYVGHGWIRL